MTSCWNHPYNAHTLWLPFVIGETNILASFSSLKPTWTFQLFAHLKKGYYHNEFWYICDNFQSVAEVEVNGGGYLYQMYEIICWKVHVRFGKKMKRRFYFGHSLKFFTGKLSSVLTDTQLTLSKYGSVWHLSSSCLVLLCFCFVLFCFALFIMERRVYIKLLC